MRAQATKNNKYELIKLIGATLIVTAPLSLYGKHLAVLAGYSQWFGMLISCCACGVIGYTMAQIFWIRKEFWDLRREQHRINMNILALQDEVKALKQAQEPRTGLAIQPRFFFTEEMLQQFQQEPVAEGEIIDTAKYLKNRQTD